MIIPPAQVARRALLTLGAAALLPGCATTAAQAPEGQQSGPRSQSPSPSPAAVCPTNPEVVAKPGNPQQYLPCEGTDIALTIDDGPHPVWTPKVLDVLARLDIQATFCVVGSNVANHPGLAARIVDGGHQIANHTNTHPMNLATLTPAQIRAEIERADDAIRAAGGGQSPRLFRAPGGTWSSSIIAACRAAELRPLDWSVDTKDWTRPGVESIVRTIESQTRPGSIILDHDGGGNRRQTVDALAIALPRLLDAGYRFVQP
jgi:peptidoglycan/xylan/chitin deacetylase (PgdA/CDA1 family)